MAFDISYVFTALDKFSAPTKAIQGSLKSLQSAITTTSEKMEMLEKKVRSFGAGMSIGLTLPIAGLAAESVKEWDKAQQSMTQLETALKSTGNTSGFTAKQFDEMSHGLQSKSMFGHIEILKDVSTTLLRFSNIHGETFKRAQQATIDFAARTGMPLKSTALLLGRALSDPERGLMRLQRQLGLTKVQLQAIQAIAKQGKIGEAQDLILQAFSKKFGGAALAQMQSGINPLRHLILDLHDAMEPLGAAIGTALLPMVPVIQKLIEGFKNLSPETIRLIAGIAGILAIAGPLGFAITGLITIITVLSSPITLAAAAIGVLAYFMYEAWKKSDTLNYMLGAVGLSLTSVFIAIRVGMGPISWIIGAIQLLAMGFMYLYKHSKAFHDLMNGFFGFLASELNGYIVVVNKLLFYLGKVSHFKMPQIPTINVGQTQVAPSMTNAGTLTNQTATQNNGFIANSLQANKSQVDINLHVNDKNETIKRVEVAQKGSAGNVNVGKNMPGIGGFSMYGAM